MKLYLPLQQKLTAYCRVVTGTECRALDLVQDTLTAAFGNFDTLRDVDSFQFFLYGIARNCYRKQSRYSKYFGKEADIKAEHIQIDVKDIELQPDVELLYTAISKLNTDQREVILMFHIMGFSLLDIVRELDITEAAVKNRLMRGREKLRNILSDKESPKKESISANHVKMKAL